MQLYLARVDRVGIHLTPEQQFDDSTETVRLIDGHRGVDMPVLYLKRKRLAAGEYLIFYRAFFRHEPSSAPEQVGGTPSQTSNKAPSRQSGYQMDDPTVIDG